MGTLPDTAKDRRIGGDIERTRLGIVRQQGRCLRITVALGQHKAGKAVGKRRFANPAWAG